MTLKKLNLIYVANTKFPSKSAHSVQIVNMCEAFSLLSNTTLLSFFSTDYDNFKKKYNIFTDFNIVKVISDKNYYFREFILLKYYFKHFRNKFDIIFTRSLIFASLIKFLTLNKSKVYYEIHDDPNENWFKYLLKIPFFLLAYNFSDKIIFTNIFLKNKYSLFVFKKSKIIILENGVSINKFNLNIDINSIKKKYNLPSKKKIITYIGGFQEWKGYKYIVQVSKLDKENIYLIVGGNEVKKIENLFYLGHLEQNEIPKILKISDILVIPNSSKNTFSSKYTSPLKLFEYLASKRPVIASDVDSIKRIVSDKEVLFFKADDVNDLYEKIHLLSKNNGLCDFFSENAYKFISNYDYNKRGEVILK